MTVKGEKLQWDAEINASGVVSGSSLAIRAMNEMQQKAASFVGRIDGSFTSVSKSAKASSKAFEQAMVEQRQAMQRLIDAADPMAAKMRQVAQAENEVNRALAAGTITAQEHALIIANMGNIAGASGRGFSNMGILVQQAGFQIADVAAVAANGGNALATAGTQLGQFLGFLGPMGAIVGAGVTILGLFVTNMLKAGDATGDASKAADLYERSLNELLDVEKQYNKVLRERQGLPALSGNTDSLKQRATETGYKAEDASNSMSWFGAAWNNAKQTFGFSRTKTDAEEARAQASLAQSDYSYASSLNEASEDEKTTIALNELNAEREKEASLLKVSAGERERARTVLNAELDVRRQLKDTMASPDQIEAEVQKAREFAAATYDQEQAEKSVTKTTKDHTTSISDLTKAREQDLRKQIELEDAKNDITNGIQEEIDKNTQLIDALRQSEEQYERVKSLLEILNQYKKAGIVLSDEETKAAESAADKIGEQNAEMNRIKENAASLKKLGSDMGMSFASAFEDAIVEAKSFSEVLQGLAQDILRLMVRQTITQPLASAASSSLSNIASSLFGGTTTSTEPNFSGTGFYASGTNSAPPGMAWVGERGPELVNFRGGEQVFPAGLSQAISSSYRLPGFADGAFDRSALASSNIGKASGDTYNIDARGSAPGVEEKIGRVIRDMQTLRNEVPSIAVKSVRSANSRGAMR